MKNVNDVMSLLSELVLANEENKKTWFFSFSGHVNALDVRVYPDGWKSYDEIEKGAKESILYSKTTYLDDSEKVEELYYWIKFTNELKG